MSDTLSPSYSFNLVNFIQNQRELFFLIDAKCKIVFANQAVLNKLYYTNGDLVGSSIYDFFDCEAGAAHTLPNFTNDEVWKMPQKCKMIDKFGVKTDFEVIAFHANLNNSKNLLVQCIEKDFVHVFDYIHQRVFDSIADPIFVIESPSGRIIQANPAVSHVYGFSMAEILQMKNVDFSVEPDKTMVALFTKQTDVLIRYHKRKNGEVFPVEIKAMSIDYGEQDIQIAICRDISHRYQYLEEIEKTNIILKSSNSFVTSLLSAIPIPVFYKDRQGKYLGCNQAFIEFMGVCLDQLIGKTVQELWPSDLATVYHQKDLELMNKFTSRQVYESFVVDKNNERKNVIYGKNVFFNEQGDVAGIVGAFIDISMQKKHQQQLEIKNKEIEKVNRKYFQINEKLSEQYDQILKLNSDLFMAKSNAEESNRLKSEFLCNFSHEVRTPLNGIMGFVDMLTDLELSMSKRKFYGEIINRSFEDLLKIIDCIMDISLVETNQIEIYFSETNINDVLKKLYLRFLPIAQKKHLDIKLSEILQDQDAKTSIDANLLTKILTNLLDNAIKYTDSGNVVLGCNFDGNSYTFFVLDSGMGIDEEDQKIVFEKFRPTKHSMGGLGLGLAISKGFVEALGGRIWFETEQNLFTNFYFTIPKRAW